MTPASAASGGNLPFLAQRGFPLSSHGLSTPHLHFLFSQVFALSLHGLSIPHLHSPLVQVSEFPLHGPFVPHLHSPFVQVSALPVQCELSEHYQYKRKHLASSNKKKPFTRDRKDTIPIIMFQTTYFTLHTSWQKSLFECFRISLVIFSLSARWKGFVLVTRMVDISAHALSCTAVISLIATFFSPTEALTSTLKTCVTTLANTITA